MGGGRGKEGRKGERERREGRESGSRETKGGRKWGLEAKEDMRKMEGSGEGGG